MGIPFTIQVVRLLPGWIVLPAHISFLGARVIYAPHGLCTTRILSLIVLDNRGSYRYIQKGYLPGNERFFWRNDK